MATVMGIDPGKRGAIATINLKTKKANFWLLSAVLENRDTPFGEIVAKYEVQRVYMEKAQSRPGQSCSAMFNYGVGYGVLQGIIRTLRLGLELVPPQTWTKEMHKGCSGKDAKEKSKNAALQLFPGQDFRASPRCVQLHDGLIDALLIAEYGRRRYGLS